MKISDILTNSDVIILDGGVSKRQFLQDISNKLAENIGVDGRAMFDIIAEREHLGSTGFGGGTALPHGRVPGLKRLKAIFAKLNKGIDFEADDNQPVDLFFILVSPENSGADHLSALAQISKIIKDKERCDKIREAKSCNDIYQLLISD